MFIASIAMLALALFAALLIAFSERGRSGGNGGGDAGERPNPSDQTSRAER